jgi:hypothetical protein
MGLDREASFEVASMTATGRPTGSHEAALAIDSLWMVHDKRAAAGEVARILEAEAPFALTTWEPPYLSYADLLESAGFEIDEEWEPDDWLTPQLAVYRGILEASETLRGQLGDEAAAVLIEEATDTSATLASVRRVCITARRIRDLPRTTETSPA